jgi:hypothetical protein
VVRLPVPSCTLHGDPALTGDALATMCAVAARSCRRGAAVTCELRVMGCASAAAHAYPTQRSPAEPHACEAHSAASPEQSRQPPAQDGARHARAAPSALPRPGTPCERGAPSPPAPRRWPRPRRPPPAAPTRRRRRPGAAPGRPRAAPLRGGPPPRPRPPAAASTQSLVLVCSVRLDITQPRGSLLPGLPARPAARARAAAPPRLPRAQAVFRPARFTGSATLQGPAPAPARLRARRPPAAGGAPPRLPPRPARRRRRPPPPARPRGAARRPAPAPARPPAERRRGGWTCIGTFRIRFTVPFTHNSTPICPSS